MKKLCAFIVGIVVLLINNLCLAVCVESKAGYHHQTVSLANEDIISGFVSLKKGFIAPGKARIILDTDGIIDGKILSSNNEPLTLFFMSDVRAGSHLEVTTSLNIDGNDNTFFLGGPLRIPDNVQLNFISNTTINGMGNELITNQALVVNDNTHLVLRNLTLQKSNQECLFSVSESTQSIELDSVIININDVQKLVNKPSNIIIRNKVTIQGAPQAKIILPAEATLTIMPHATLCIEGVTLACEHKATGDQILFADATSTINFNQSSFEILGDTIFTRGKVTCNNEVIFNVAPNRSLQLGDGKQEANNFNLILLGGTSLKIDGSGTVIDRSV